MRPRQRIGKYRIEKKLDEGGFATVYQAMDTVEGVRVALKVPHASLSDSSLLEECRNEIRLASRLQHPNILMLKNADEINGRLIMAYPLGVQTLHERLHKRLSVDRALEYAEKMLRAVAYAHAKKVIHCDIKPENMILLPDGDLMLADLGIAKVARKTVRASGSGTIGYCAPEQAMGRPSFRSDVFSLGLIMYRMFSGKLPEWPFHWPAVGYEQIKKRVHPDLVSLIRCAIDVDPRQRFRDAGAMLEAFLEIKPAVCGHLARKPLRRPSRANRKRR